MAAGYSLIIVAAEFCNTRLSEAQHVSSSQLYMHVRAEAALKSA